jgi:hypothetical protein
MASPQGDFETFLRSGLLPAGHEVEPEPTVSLAPVVAV